MPRLHTLTLVVCGAGVLLLVASLVVLPPNRLTGQSAPPLNHVAGAYHVHSVVSDGTGTVDQIAAAAARAGLQFVIVTDHGDGTRVPLPAEYRSGVLCLDAVEISTRDGHYIAIDMPRAPFPLGGEARDVVDDVRRLGGFGVAAHPDSSKPELQWRYRDLPIDAIEWINADSEWRDESAAHLLGALLTYPFRPAETLASLLDRPDSSLSRWDARANGPQAIVGLAGADAHAGLGWGTPGDPYERDSLVGIPSYEAAFRTFSQRLILDEAPSRNAARDAALVYRALRAGRAYSVIDGLASAGRIEFLARSNFETTTMGGRLRSTGLVTIEARVEAPDAVQLTLLSDGMPVHQTTGPELTFELPARPGAIRLEAHLPGAAGTPPVPWIVTNPIYIGAATSASSLSVPQVVALGPSDTALPPGGWTTEQAQGSTLDLTRGPGSTSVELRFELGPASSVAPNIAPYVALNHNLDLMQPIPTQISLRAWSDGPRRLSVQLRTGEPERRWQRSIYVDETPRVHILEIGDFREVTEGGPQGSPERVEALLVVVDTVNTAPGTRGSFWIDDVAVRSGSTSDQVRTPSRR